jgi:putative ABC transport system ATP-binding protein
LIEARKLRKVYGGGDGAVIVLDGVDLQVAAGEMIAIVGPSGAGKSTLLHLVAALDTPTSGTVYFESSPLEMRRDEAIAEFRNRRIGFVWQRHHLLPTLTAIENVQVPMFEIDLPRSERAVRAQRLLDEVGLTHRRSQLPSRLSGGERQRVAIARALANEPAVLLADEPTGNLDSANGAAIFALLQELHAAGTTIVVITHDHQLAERLPRQIEMLDGHILRDSSSSPSRPIVAGLDGRTQR